MSWRKGYSAEYSFKKESEKKYGVGNAIKVAIGGSSDFIIIYKGRLYKFVEIKETKKPKYYPSPKEKLQFNEIVRLAKQHNVKAELHIYYKKGRGKPTTKSIMKLYYPDVVMPESNPGRGL